MTFSGFPSNLMIVIGEVLKQIFRGRLTNVKKRTFGDSY